MLRGILGRLLSKPNSPVPLFLPVSYLILVPGINFMGIPLGGSHGVKEESGARGAEQRQAES